MYVTGPLKPSRANVSIRLYISLTLSALTQPSLAIESESKSEAPPSIRSWSENISAKCGLSLRERTADGKYSRPAFRKMNLFVPSLHNWFSGKARLNSTIRLSFKGCLASIW